MPSIEYFIFFIKNGEGTFHEVVLSESDKELMQNILVRLGDGKIQCVKNKSKITLGKRIKTIE